MGDATIGRELDELLGESLEAARRRAASQLSSQAGPLVLYGAGNLGQLVLARLRHAGVEPIAFADDTPAKQGQIIQGLPVMAPREIVTRFRGQIIFAVTIFNPQASFLAIARPLQQATGVRVVPFLSLAWQYPEAFLPYGQFELPENVLAKAPDIRRAFRLWEDEESRRQFVAHLKFRLFLDYEALPGNSCDNYFPPNVLPPLPPETTFVDCGAYDGDTIQCFLQHQQGCFREIFAFEPDERNCEKLRDYVSTLGADAAGRIHIYNAGVGSNRSKMRFNPTGNTGAAFDDAGEAEVEVLPVQEIVDGSQSSVYVKFDVEGAEWEALKGTRELIERAQPILAVSIYHRPDDLWQLPFYLKSLNPDYKLFLRTQGEDGMDVICYAVPGPQL